MIKPFFSFFILFLAIVLNFQGSSKTYLVKTHDEKKESEDYYITACDSIQSRTSYGGKTDTTVTARNAKDCASKCFNHGPCLYWTLSMSRSSNCYLKAETGSVSSNARYTSGHWRYKNC